MKKGIIIIGTDTGVGKTKITTVLLELCNQENFLSKRYGGMKPIETGIIPTEPEERDAILIKKAAKMDDPIDLICPYSFRYPLAPVLAAEKENTLVQFDTIKKAYDTLSQKYDVLFVELAGGLLVPLNHTQTNLDLLKVLDLPFLLVSKNVLGGINHTLLTLSVLKNELVDFHQRCIGVILSNITSVDSIVKKTNGPIIAQYTQTPVLSSAPYDNTSDNRYLKTFLKTFVLPELSKKLSP